MAKYICPMCGEWNSEKQKYCRKCNTWLLDTNHQSKRVTGYLRKNGKKDYMWIMILLFLELLFVVYASFKQPSFSSKKTGALLIEISIVNLFIAFIFGMVALIGRRRMGALRLTLASFLIFSLGVVVPSIHGVQKGVSNLPSVLANVPTPSKPGTWVNSPVANRTILSHLEARQTTFSVPVSSASPTVVKNDVAYALKTDEYLALSVRNYSFRVVTFGSVSTATFKVNYWEDWNQYMNVQNGVKQVLKQILNPKMDDFAKEKAIHDYVVLCVAYDESAKRYSAYDALFNRSAVCQGYAMLTYQLLKAAGIPNYIVVGTATNRIKTEGHSWNEVELHGKWYQMDTTWDDPVPDVPGRVLYNYFNLTDSEMARNHTWSHVGLPIANTDYINTIESIGNSQDKEIIHETGLIAEQSKATYKDFAQLQGVLAGQKPGQYVFRYPYNQVVDLKQLRLPYASHWSYTQDTRDPEYAIVNMTIG